MEKSEQKSFPLLRSIKLRSNKLRLYGTSLRCVHAPVNLLTLARIAGERTKQAIK